MAVSPNDPFSPGRPASGDASPFRGDEDSREAMRLAVPSDGVMHEQTLDFLSSCGMRVRRPSARGYTGSIPAVKGVEVVFQRTADISARVEAGDADMGLVGYDRFAESRLDDGDSLLVMEDLGFGRCALVVAVPDSWIDVDSMADLADIAVEFQESGRELRVATKYPTLTRAFLHRHDVNYFSLALLSGTVEPAPSIGYADLIVDLTASGQTLRENHLKQVADGTVLESEGALVANRRLLATRPERLEAARDVIERIEASMQAAGYMRVTANIESESEEAVAAQVMQLDSAVGLHGPTVARVYSPDGRRLYSATVFIAKSELTPVVDHLRAIGGASVTVSNSDYVFGQSSRAYERLLGELGLA